MKLLTSAISEGEISALERTLDVFSVDSDERLDGGIGSDQLAEGFRLGNRFSRGALLGRGAEALLHLQDVGMPVENHQALVTVLLSREKKRKKVVLDMKRPILKRRDSLLVEHVSLLSRMFDLLEANSLEAE